MLLTNIITEGLQNQKNRIKLYTIKFQKREWLKKLELVVLVI